jgi:glycosyltransferase involved in cell wall biosynthesis
MPELRGLSPEAGPTVAVVPTTSRAVAALPRLVVAIPALNEQATIGEVIAGIPRQIEGLGSVEVVVVDDGSADGTGSTARSLGAHVLRHPVASGVGAAFHSALAYALQAGADLLVTLDGDGQFDPAHIPQLVRPVVERRADFVTASRFKDPALVPRMPAVKRWGNRLMSRIVSRLIGQRFWDVSCGMRCYSRRAIENLHVIGRFTYTQEVFLCLASKRMAMLELAVPVRGVRAVGESRVAKNVVGYAWRAGKIIVRACRDYYPLRFFTAAAAVLLVPASGLGAFLSWHFVSTGNLSPHKWAGFLAGGLLGLAVLCLHLGVVGDMMVRHRVYLEELLSLARSAAGSERPGAARAEGGARRDGPGGFVDAS